MTEKNEYFEAFSTIGRQELQHAAPCGPLGGAATRSGNSGFARCYPDMLSDFPRISAVGRGLKTGVRLLQGAGGETDRGEGPLTQCGDIIAL